jgi:general secretion pathway protein I
LSRATAREHWRARAGFTIIEVLVALAVMATSLAAIGAVAAANARGSRALDQRVALLQTARAVETGIPRRRDLAFGETEGEIAGHRWWMEVRPLAVDGVPDSPWVPKDIVIRVRAPSGATIKLETVRLTRSAAQ